MRVEDVESADPWGPEIEYFVSCLEAGRHPEQGTGEQARLALARRAGRQSLARERAAGAGLRLGVEAALVGGELVAGDVEIADGLIVGVGLSPKGKRGIAVPGFVDLQVNGFAGVDFLGASAVDWGRARERFWRRGVTTFQPTFITASEEALIDALRGLPPWAIGVQLEGAVSVAGSDGCASGTTSARSGCGSVRPAYSMRAA